MTTRGTNEEDAWLPSSQQPNGEATPVHFANKACIELIDLSQDEPIGKILDIVKQFLCWSGALWHSGGSETFDPASCRGPEFTAGPKAKIEGGVHEERASQDWIYKQAIKVVDLIFYMSYKGHMGHHKGASMVEVPT